MNAQEIFDTVAKHLATQGHRAMGAGGDRCVYRSPDGEKCAVGCLIADSEYSESMEDYSACGVHSIAQRDLLPERLRSFVPLLASLQEAHDGRSEVDGMSIRGRLDVIADRYDLSPAILDTLQFPEVWS